MSIFDRLQLDAYLVRLRTAMDADAMAAAGGIAGSRWRKIADRATVEIYEAVQALEAALDEIDRLASAEHEAEVVMSGLRDKLSLIAALAMVGCAACATLAWLNQDVWYLWVTLAGVALLVAIVTRDW